MIHDARNTKTRYIHYTKFDQTCTSYSRRSRLQNAFASENRSDSNSTTNRRSGACYQRERKATEENVAKRFGFVFSANRTEPEENVVRRVSPTPACASERKRKKENMTRRCLQVGRMQASSCHELKEALGSSGS